MGNCNLDKNYMKKILIVTDNLPDQINGVVTTFNNIEKILTLKGYTVTYINPEKFNYISCPGYNEVKLSIPLGIKSAINKSNADYIHIATEGPIGLFTKLYCDLHNIKYTTSYHTKFPEFLKKIYNIPEYITYKYLKWFHSKSKKVLVPTKDIKNILNLKGFKNLKIWTRGVDSDIFNPSRRTNPDNYLICVSRVSKEKGLDDFCKLKGNKILVGNGPYLKELKEIYPDVNFVGVKMGIELSELISNASVFIFPSKTDTFGIVILEAIACGTPVASYEEPGPKEVISLGINGFYGENLEENIINCLKINREDVYSSSKKWTWEISTNQFLESLLTNN